MVVKTPPISSEIAARMAAENARQFAGDTKAREVYESLHTRMWCVEQAVAVCGSDGVMWHTQRPKSSAEIYKVPDNPPDPLSAVVPIAEEILRFITADSKS